MHAAGPEDVAEDARRAQHAPRLGLERVEARLHHREHRLGQWRRCALGDGADQLFEVEGVARARARRCARRSSASTSSPSTSRTSCSARFVVSAAEADRGATPRSAQRRGKTSSTSGRASASTMQRPLARAAERGVDEADARQIAPVQIVEHEDQRVRARTRRRRSPPTRAASDRPSAMASPRAARSCGALSSSRDGAPTISPRNSATRRTLGGGDVPRRRARGAFAGAPRAARRRARRRRDGRAARARRTASPRSSDRRARSRPRRAPSRADAAEELVAKPRLADAGRRRDEHRARDRLVDAPCESSASSDASSRSRPTHGVGSPRSVRDPDLVARARRGRARRRAWRARRSARRGAPRSPRRGRMARGVRALRPLRGDHAPRDR